MATKKVLPYAESANVNEASQYSILWSRVKYIPSDTVVMSPMLAWV